jgi:cell division protein FtsL
VNAFFRSMSGRVFLILLLGILAAASLTYWLAFGERQRTMVQFRDAAARMPSRRIRKTLPLMERKNALTKAPRR